MKQITTEQIKELKEKYSGSDKSWEYYPVFCPGCGWYGMSDENDSYQIGQTGDHTDPTCPKCECVVQDVEHLTGDLRYKNKI